MFLVSWPGGSWEATVRMLVVVFALYLAALWITLVFWTYRDIRQRTRDPIIQSVSVLLVLVFFLPGHWLYLILRPRYTLTELYERSLEEEALLQELEDQKSCPTCKRRVFEDYLICPSCRTQLKEPCRSCAKPLSYAWYACPYCGLEKPPREPIASRPARPGLRPPNGRQAQPTPVAPPPQPMAAVAAPAKEAPPREPAPRPVAAREPAPREPAPREPAAREPAAREAAPRETTVREPAEPVATAPPPASTFQPDPARGTTVRRQRSDPFATRQQAPNQEPPADAVIGE